MDKLTDKVKDWSRRISSSAIPRHLERKILKCVIWISLSYTLTYTSFSKVEGDQIASDQYRLSLPNLGVNGNPPKTLRYITGEFIGLGLPHTYQEQGIKHIKT